MDSAQQFLARTKSEILRHPFLSATFIERVAQADPFPLQQAQKFARAYYPHILRTRLYQACAMGITPDERIQTVFADILYDEYGNGDAARSHMQLYRNFMLAVGVTPSAQPDRDIIPELQKYIDATMQLVQGGPWMAAVGAVGIASEWPIPEYYRRLLAGLKTIPGIQMDALELFAGHIDLDLEHARMMEEALLPHLEEPRMREQFLAGIERNLNLRLELMTGLDREVFGS